MNATQNKPKSKVARGILISLVLGINIVRLLVGTSHKPVASEALTADQLYQLTSHPVTGEQALASGQMNP